MGLGRNTGLQRHGNRVQYDLLVTMQNQGKDLDHLPVAARRAQQMPLQPLEGVRHLEERRAVAQGSRLALDDHQIMAPVINSASRTIMGSAIIYLS